MRSDFLGFALSRTTTVTWFFVFASTVCAQSASPQSSPLTPLAKTTYVYKTVGDTRIQADIYRSPGTDKQPVVVWIHGGALIVGSRSQVPANLLDLCTREKLILVSLDYRLAPEVKLPEITSDVKDAFAWLRKNGAELFGADTTRLVVTGGSAGGFLTMLTGATVEPKPTALVAYWGYGDIDAMWATGPSDHYRTQTAVVPSEEAMAAVNRGSVLTNTNDPAVQRARGNYYRHLRQTGRWSREVTGIDASRGPEKLKPFCPVQLITPQYPPLLMVHGTADTDVPYECSQKMSVALQKSGVKHTLITVEGAEHGLRDGDPKKVAAAHQQALEFIRAHLKTVAPAGAFKNVDNHITAALAAIRRVGPEGQGAVEARAAAADLAHSGVDVLPQLLTALNTDNPVAANWLRSIYEELVQRELKRQDTVWPIEFLKQYVSDHGIAGRPRRLVLALLDKLEPGFSEPWLPTRLDDPEFRYDAVALAIESGEAAVKRKQPDEAKVQLQRAFENARNSTQVTQAAGLLKSLGVAADVTRHLGLVTDWWLIGPFDAPGKSGFQKIFEPEKNVDLSAKYSISGNEMKWIQHHADDILGQLNLITIFGTTQEAVAYAYSEVSIKEGRTANLCCGADDNCTVWLNGEKVLAREQWLNGIRFDRFVTPVKLQAGRNRLLVKICQGPQHKDPEVQNNWSMHLRICDNQGRGIDFQSLPPK